MDIVISRVTSPTDFTSSPRNRQTSRSWSIRSAGRFEPTVGRRGHQERSEHLGQAADPRVPLLDRVRVVLGELGELVVVLRRIVVLHDAAPVGERQEVRPGRMHAIPVPFQLEVAQDRVGHQAHHVAERGDLELGRLRPRRHRVGRAAGLVPGLQDHGPRAGFRQVRRGDQPVVAAADHDRVVLVGSRDAAHATPERPFSARTTLGRTTVRTDRPGGRNPLTGRSGDVRRRDDALDRRRPPETA